MKNYSDSFEKKEWSKEPDATALECAMKMNHADAEGKYRALVEKGSVLSMINLGHIYEYKKNKDTDLDSKESEFWYKKAVDAGSAIATLHCGYFYIRRKDYEKAREIFSIGAVRGYAPSIVRLANLYIKGYGVDRDYDKAIILLRQASDLGNIWAKLAIATMTVTLADSTLIRLKGMFMVFFAGVQFRVQKWRDPKSERLIK